MTATLALAALLAASAFAGPKPDSKPVWTVGGLDQPESAHYDAATGAIYVSNVAGEADGKDGKGWISKLDLKGKVVKKKWADGLNAPKSARACGGKLYVADLDALVVVDMSSGVVKARVAMPGAKMLNGMAVDEKCGVYVADTFASRLYYYSTKGDASVLASGPELQSPNGLALDGKTLVIAAWGLTTDWKTPVLGRLLRLDLATKKITPVPGPRGNLDGLVRVKKDWFVSDWVSGGVLRAEPNGQTSVLMRGFQGPADLGLAPGLLLVPRMLEGRLDAYAL